MAKPRGPHKIKAKGSEPPRKSGLPQLKTWRIKRGLTVAALAEKAGLSAGTVSGIENGTQSFSDDSLTRLARALGGPRRLS